MNIRKFEIRQYGRTELAQVYSPDVTPESAWKKLRGWIDFNQVLTSRLQRLSYDPHRQRTFTPAQVRAIVEELGEP
jgi:hypothetical protein